MREMLRHRIRSGGPFTWADLCRCLRKFTVGRPDIAIRIERDKFSGKYNLHINHYISPPCVSYAHTACHLESWAKGKIL